MNDGNERSGPGQPPTSPDDPADRTGVITHGNAGNGGQQGPPPPWQRGGASGPGPNGPLPGGPPPAQPPPRRPGFDVGEPEHTTTMRPGGAYTGGSAHQPHERPTVYVEPTPAREPAVPTDSGGMFDRETLRAESGLGPDSASGGFPRPGSSSRIRPGRVPRRASLQLKRLDPWSVLKLSLVLSIAGFFVWMVAVGVLYVVLDGMGVWDEFNGTYSDLTSVDNDPDGDVVSAGRVFGVAALVGLVNVVLMTALATVGSFIYNMSSDLVGGVEVTLAERD